MACRLGIVLFSTFFFFNDTATTEIYTLSLHDALPISSWFSRKRAPRARTSGTVSRMWLLTRFGSRAIRWSYNSLKPSRKRSEEHTSELQSQSNLVCRLLLEKTKHKTMLSALQKRRPTR